MHPETERLFIARATQTQRVLGTRLLRPTSPLDLSWAPSPAATGFAQRPQGEALRPIREGDPWGTGNAHGWFHARAPRPAAGADERAVVWLDLGAEGLIHSASGHVTQGIAPGNLFDNTFWKGTRPIVELEGLEGADGTLEFWVQAATLAHPDTQAFVGPVPRPAGLAGNPHGIVQAAQVALLNEAVWDLYMDFEVALDLLQSLPPGSVRRAKLLHHLSRAAELIARAPQALAEARAALAPALHQPAAASDLRVFAVGHGHLDTAWLWTTATARQKCARTAANQLQLMRQYPEHVFGMSSALHYQWLQEDHPQLFAEIRHRIAEGRWEVQGMQWVEADAQLPGGEAQLRQFLHGALWFQENLGLLPRFAWLPDAFGFPGSLPQIMRHCGAEALVTQKISWSQFNAFPHSAFHWQGIDGSRVLTYFPPENTYSADLMPSQLRAGQERCPERGRVDAMLSLFGYGDGGGGPHAKHLERARRCARLEGCPPVQLRPAAAFLEHLAASAPELETWVGPLYLELHRGTFTTQARIKQLNRRIEEQLLATESLWARAPLGAWPAALFDEAWKLLLQNQFHDIIPGTSIAEVYAQTEAEYASLRRTLDQARSQFAQDHLRAAPEGVVVYNSLATDYADHLLFPGLEGACELVSASGEILPLVPQAGGLTAAIAVPALSCRQYTLRPVATPGAAPAPAQRETVELQLESAHVRYTFAADGTLRSAHDKRCQRELIRTDAAANTFTLYHDHPCQWEAWDIDVFYEAEAIETARARTPAQRHESALGTELHFDLAIGQSRIRQVVRLAPDGVRLDFATTLDWHEQRRHLRVAFPLALAARQACCDTPYGHVVQPTHRNTCREYAMFEHVAHKFVDLVEGDYGVALINDGRFGHKLHGNTIDLALARAPQYPDPQADQGTHHLRYALFPHDGGAVPPALQATAAGFNRPPLVLLGHALPEGDAPDPIALQGDPISLEAHKRAERGTDWVVRLVERLGRRSQVVLRFAEPMDVVETDGLEQADLSRSPGVRELKLTFESFQIRTFRYRPSFQLAPIPGVLSPRPCPACSSPAAPDSSDGRPPS